MLLPLTVSCFSKIQTVFTFLVPAYPGSPGKRAIKQVCVCVLILQVISKDDHNWWQARRWGAPPSEPAGLVPSPELQEWRTACAAIEKAKRDQAGPITYCICLYFCGLIYKISYDNLTIILR